jgi:polyisoprenoid-binding protein YceI
MRISFFLCLLMAWSLQAQNYLARTGKVQFTSIAPLEVFSAGSDQLSGVLQGSRFAFSVPTASLHGFNSPLQEEHFHENYIESGKYPKATYSGVLLDPLPAKGTVRILATGRLSIHGIDRERIIPFEITRTEKGYRIQAAFEVALDDHKITVPRVVKEKIAPHMDVEIDITLNQQP